MCAADNDWHRFGCYLKGRTSAQRFWGKLDTRCNTDSLHNDGQEHNEEPRFTDEFRNNIDVDGADTFVLVGCGGVSQAAEKLIPSLNTND
jgi:Asp/Glu/hydantoin racemase